MKRLQIIGLVCFVALVAQAQELPAVVPAPRQMAWTTGTPASVLVRELKGFVLPAEGDVAGGIELVNMRLIGLSLSPLSVMPNGAIRLAVQPAPDFEKALAALPEPKAQGYRLRVNQDGIVILGKDLPGLFYGLVTLSHLIAADGTVPCVTIADWPDQLLRGSYITGSRSDMEQYIRRFASLKYNLALIETGEFYALDNPEMRAHWQQLFDLCRRYFIEPVPELQSLGWGQFVLEREPRAVEAVAVEQQPFTVSNGHVVASEVPAPPMVRVANPSFEEAAGDKAEGWTIENPGVNAFVDRQGAKTGACCIRLTTPVQTTVRGMQDVTCLAQKRYELSCYLKTQDVQSGTAYIEVYGLDADGKLGNLLAHTEGRGGSQDWQLESVVFDSGDYTKLQIYIRIQEASGTAWFDDVLLAGVKPSNPLANVIVTAAAPLVVQNAAGDVTYEQGKDYALHLPKLSFPFKESDPLDIEILPGSQIKNNDTVRLTYQYAPPDSITCCPSEPLYQEFMRKAVGDTLRYLKPNYLHIGHDEPRLMGRDKRCKDRGLSNSEIFVDDIKRMRDYAREVDPSIRVMMWDDAVNPYQNGPMLGMSDAAPLIPKDVIICVWWYDLKDAENQIVKSAKYFLDLGFEITGSPWFIPQNAYEWAQTLYRDGKDNPRVLGEIYTSWAHPFEDPWGALDTTAEYAWTFEQPVFKP